MCCSQDIFHSSSGGSCLMTVGGSRVSSISEHEIGHFNPTIFCSLLIVESSPRENIFSEFVSLLPAILYRVVYRKREKGWKPCFGSRPFPKIRSEALQAQCSISHAYEQVSTEPQSGNKQTGQRLVLFLLRLRDAPRRMASEMFLRRTRQARRALVSRSATPT